MRTWLPAALLGAALLAPGCARSSRAPAPAPPAGIFRDVAAEAGLDFRWGHGGKTPLNILETIGHGCAFLDYDQDGHLDILLAGNERCALFRNQGDGRFAEVSAQAGLTEKGHFIGVAVGDYDNDGYPDAFVTGYGGSVLYRNTGRGGFEDVTAAAGLATKDPYDFPTAAAFADLDEDGKLDLFVGRYIVFTPASPQLCTYHGVRAGCGVKSYPALLPRVWRGDGARFTDVTTAWGFDAADGKCLGVAVRASDSGRGVLLYAANDEQPGNLWTRRGGRYVDIGVPSGTAFNRDGLTQGGMGVDWGDVNNDGLPDLIVATFQSEPRSLYRADGSDLYMETGGTLGIGAPTAIHVGWTARFFDYDNDGWLDLLLTNGHVQDNVHRIQKDRSYAQPTQLFHNEQGRLFREATAEAGPAFAPIVGRGAAFGDYDNDGQVDVLLVDEEGAARLLRNEARTDGNWLGVRLTGTRCNRDAIGARVTVEAGGRRLVRDLQLAGGYISAHDPRLHFGLGAAGRAERVTVRWPDGTQDTLTDVAAGRYLEITQGQGQAEPPARQARR